MGAPTSPKKAARKTPARKAATAAPQVKATVGVFDLDSLTKADVFPDLGLPTTPFQFLLAGHQYELTDPRDNDWKEAWRLAANPFLLMRACLVGADDPVDNPTKAEIEVAKERLRQDTERQEPGGEDGEEPEGEDADAEESGEDADAEEPKIVPTLLDRFTAAPLPGWKLNALLDNWHQHYKIDLSSGRGILDALLGRNDADE